ncbi:MAG: GNAT family N-acetyltransferase [Bacteriovorax sp.]
MIISPMSITLKNNQTVTLRSPNPDEAQQLLSHLKRTFHESYKNLNMCKHHWDNFPVEEEQKILESFAHSSDKFMISAFVGNEIIGNLGLFGMGAEFVKYNARIGMGIEKQFHNLGLGSAMLNCAFSEAKKAGFHRLELTVRTYNHPGIALYEKVGFTRVGLLREIAFIDGKFYDEYIYELLLN